MLRALRDCALDTVPHAGNPSTKDTDAGSGVGDQFELQTAGSGPAVVSK